MSGQSSSPYGETDAGTDTAAPATASSRAPHGRAMTACLVAANVALVALVYLYFWRVFSRKRAASSSAASGADDDDASSSASAPPSPARDDDEQQRRIERLVASLPPPFVARHGAAGGSGAECAVCIGELRDGDEARALPRCGHRFHAACVDAWLRRRHTTCPLCRASVVVAAAAEDTGPGPKGGGVAGTTAAAVEDMDAPV
ncbi:unnamed protein product [Urochloa decumbens]|uniref:RING-type E3 ubiquitin transferase n=1 Tax=Urochloa decumbens TaxID=240449 RepID=A0ABC8YXD1_9POAL